jgi:hypothetical protein
MCAIADAVRWAEEIMKEIDERWPEKEKTEADQKKGWDFNAGRSC